MAAAAAVTCIGTLVLLNDPMPQAGRYTVAVGAEERPGGSEDPLRSELARCRTLPADTDDARCRAAWEVNRSRFMGESRSLAVPVEPAQPLPFSGPIPPSGTQAPEH